MRAVLFDLDDTLYDHLFAARSGLAAMQARTSALQTVPLERLEEIYSDSLETIHHLLLRGEVSQTEARVRRMQEVFGHFDVALDDAEALDRYTRFRRDYDEACRVVEGSHEVLRALQRWGLRLGVITNNLVSEQTQKLRQLELTDYFEVVSISEEVGTAKPDPVIFHVTLERLGLQTRDVVMVGDSLTSDIAGALRVGMRCVWLDRQPEQGLRAPRGVPTLGPDFSDWRTAAELIAGR